ncbi:HlyC/CorC family transporter [bacterium]|nr:HlyC/CorC family transporter [bacterium]
MTTFFMLALLFLLIAVNAFFVLAEFVSISVTPVQLEQECAEHQWARNLYGVLTDSVKRDRYIVVAQLGVTFASLLLGYVSENALARHLLTAAHHMGYSPDNAAVHGVAMFLSLMIITYLHVVLGEMVPKRLGIDNPLRYARWVERPMRWLGVLLWPFVWFLNDCISNSVLRSLHLPVSQEVEKYTPEDLLLAFDESSERGQLEGKYNDWCQNVIELSKHTLRQVMTPRVKVVGISKDATIEEALSIVKEEGYSRYPVYQDNLDHIVGMVHVRHLFKARMSGQAATMDDIKSECASFPESMDLDDALDKMRANCLHMVAVVDEFGGIAGIATMEDIIEEIFGEVFDEFDGEEIEPIKSDEASGAGYWLVEGSVMLDDLSEEVDVTIKRDEVYTVGGLVMDQLDRLPKRGDKVSIAEGLEFEVLEIEDMVPALCRVHRRAKA